MASIKLPLFVSISTKCSGLGIVTVSLFFCFKFSGADLLWLVIINAQVAGGGKVPTKQPSHEHPVPGSLQAPVTLKPDGSVERKKNAEKSGGGDREGTPRTAKL